MEKCSLNAFAKSVVLLIETQITTGSLVSRVGVTFAGCKFAYSLPGGP